MGGQAVHEIRPKSPSQEQNVSVKHDNEWGRSLPEDGAARPPQTPVYAAQPSSTATLFSRPWPPRNPGFQTDILPGSPGYVLYPLSLSRPRALASPRPTAG